MNTLQSMYNLETVVRSIREFFHRKNFHEVITPILHTGLPLEPTAYPLITFWQKMKAGKTLYLATSPESFLKKMLATGLGNCFAISKSFRNLEDGGKLNLPEFLMLEWYREKADYILIMKEIQELIIWINEQLPHYGRKESFFIDQTKKWQVYSFIELFDKYANLDYGKILSGNNLFPLAKKQGYLIEKDTTWEQLFNQLFLNGIYPHLPLTPFFLVDFPGRISPLCKVRKTNPQIAERFELFIGGIEIANGNTESTDSVQITKFFSEERMYRKRNQKLISVIDQGFISAVRKMGKKPYTYAGAGLGIERLVMILTNKSDIKDVVLQEVV